MSPSPEGPPEFSSVRHFSPAPPAPDGGIIRSSRPMKPTTYIFVICCIIASGLRSSSCSSTGDQDFAANVRLHLSASDRYDQIETVFELQFSTVGKETIHPGKRSRLVLFVDGK